ncbi:MAG: hypothetical protein IK004_05420 [Bacteroidales bacterium]|nr:hypothetical protein [Bacteroidales bacterium]
MAITSDRLRQTFSEGGALEIYHEIKSGGDFLGFTKQWKSLITNQPLKD